MATPLLLAAQANENKTLDIAAPPGWVQAIAAPVADGSNATAATRTTLRDEQLDFGPDGTTSSYWHDRIEVQTPEGLAKLGTVSFSWNPETDRITVHQLHILRGTEVIDVLKTQSFTILRRETNLERAAIDGTLTASLQLAGLQVGDTVDFAATRRHLDPALRGHRAFVMAFRPLAQQSRLTARWPRAAPMHWHATPDLPVPVSADTGATTTFDLRAADLKEPLLPNGAPVRFRQAYVADFSDFKDWAQVAALMAPLYAKASTLAPGGPVAQEAARIAAASRDPVARAEAALALVQNQVRYLFIGLNDGGYVPADAETTWTRRFGDCKGKTVLLLGLLHGLGIDAQPVLVNATGLGDAIPTYLPSAGIFNHVLVRATIAGRTYWLDGTRLGDRRLADIETPAFRWGLPVQPADAALVAIMPGPAERPFGVTTLRLDASAGVDKPVPAHGDYVVRGDAAIGMQRALAAMTQDVRDRSLRELWRKIYDYIQPETVAARFDPATGAETLSIDGTARLDWNADALELTRMQLGASVDFTREPGPHADAPFAVPFPRYDVYRERITLPAQGDGFALDPMAFDRTIAGIRYQRDGRIEAGVVTLELSRRAVAPEFPAAEASAAQEELRHLTHQHAYLHRTLAR